jgi:hypothetical protein
MPPVYPGYPQFTRSTTWNPFKRSQLKKREKALREYLYTTPMILQYPGAFASAPNFFHCIKQPFDHKHTQSLNQDRTSFSLGFHKYMLPSPSRPSLATESLPRCPLQPR